MDVLENLLLKDVPPDFPFVATLKKNRAPDDGLCVYRFTQRF